MLIIQLSVWSAPNASMTSLQLAAESAVNQVRMRSPFWSRQINTYEPFLQTDRPVTDVIAREWAEWMVQFSLMRSDSKSTCYIWPSRSPIKWGTDITLYSGPYEPPLEHQPRHVTDTLLAFTTSQRKTYTCRHTYTQSREEMIGPHFIL